MALGGQEKQDERVAEARQKLKDQAALVMIDEHVRAQTCQTCRRFQAAQSRVLGHSCLTSDRER